MYFLLMTLIFFLKKKLSRGIPTWIVLIYCGSCHQGGNARTISSARWSVELVYISNALSVFIWVFVFHDTAGLSLMMWFFFKNNSNRLAVSCWLIFLWTACCWHLAVEYCFFYSCIASRELLARSYWSGPVNFCGNHACCEVRCGDVGVQNSAFPKFQSTFSSKRKGISDCITARSGARRDPSRTSITERKNSAAETMK